MSELIKTVIGIKDPFTLFAFLAVVLLVAFRTKTVPESVFKLIGEKIGRDRFYALLNRSLVYVFTVFLILCGIAVLGEVLGYKTKVEAASVDELKRELTARDASDAASKLAIEGYERGLALARDQKVSEAIGSLESSLKAIPTATARETLALLYQRAGDRERAIQVAQEAVSAARETGDTLKTVKAERVLSAVIKLPARQLPTSCPADAGLVGAKLDLPPGGDSFETATTLVPCVYKGMSDVDASLWKYYKVSVPPGKMLKVVFRTRDVDASKTKLRLHDANGISLGGYDVWGESATAKPLEYKADEGSAAYVSVTGSVRGAAFDFQLH